MASDSYNDKMATTIASGEIPDLSFVQDSSAVAAKAIDDGVFADLTEVLAGDNILQWPNLANVSENAWKASAKNGHIFGVPNENGFLSNYPAIRWDLMEAVGADAMPADAAALMPCAVSRGLRGPSASHALSPPSRPARTKTVAVHS